MDTVEFMHEAFDKRLAHRRAKPGLKSMELFYGVQKNYYQNIMNAREEGKPLAWLGLFTPLEIIHAMDIVPLIAEAHSINVGFPAAQEYIQLGEGHGVYTEACSPHRVGMGIALAGAAPAPDMIVSTAHTCDSTVKIFENFSKYFKKPTYFIDRAYRYDQDGLEYYKEEIRGLISFLEENTGRKLDYGRLIENCKRSLEGFGHWVDISRLRQNRPSPVNGRDAFRDRGVMMVAAGQPEAGEYFEVRYKELKDKVARGEGAIADEKYRIVWLYAPPFHDLKIMDWMEQEHQTIVAIDTFNNLAEDFRSADPTDPIDYLAKRSYSDTLARSTYGDASSGALDTVYKMCEDWHADGVVFFAHFSCKQYCGLLHIYKDGIESTLNIPTVTVDGDLMDPRVVSGEQMRVKLREFFAMMKAKEAAV
jgi:benzoyl-CoA reductase/2-hydroxyglutaryl-CoA dehydratase subunit BcrC/BadD/HgdB